MSKLKGIIATILVAAMGFIGYAVATGDSAQAAEVKECGDNAIIRCGAMTPSELKSKYAANDRGLKAIYNYYNIDATDIANSGSAKIGYVHTNGTVTVDGKVVATDANTVGRSGSLGGKKVNANGHTVYEGPDRLKSTLSAYVFFNSDGTFKSAVLRVCGNPVKAKPVPVVKPVYSCDVLSATKISRTEYEFVAKATAKNGATIKSYSYTFGDKATATTGSSTRHTYTKDGTYTATVTVNVTVNGSAKTATSKTCQVAVTVSPAPVSPITVCDTDTKKIIQNVMPNNMKPSYTTDLSKCQTTPVTPVVPELPKTGMGEIIGSGAFGAGALTLTGYYYYMSRKQL